MTAPTYEAATGRRGPADWLRRQWALLRAGFWLEAGQYGGDYERLDRFYAVEDPWRLATPRERARFELTNGAIAAHVPDCGALLEIGAGEGIQTAHLLEVARHVTGLEVSAVAAARARRRVPEADFLVGSAEEVLHIAGLRRFDLITACEMLYYVPDVGETLARLQQLAPRLLVTNYEKRDRLLAHHFERPGWTRLTDMVADGTRWHCRLWEAPRG